jgi:hypothetical protein
MTKTKDEIFKKHLLGIMTYSNIMAALDEYGKYCAEKAWNENRLYGTFFEDWWNEFNKTETL